MVAGLWNFVTAYPSPLTRSSTAFLTFLYFPDDVKSLSTFGLLLPRAVLPFVLPSVMSCQGYHFSGISGNLEIRGILQRSGKSHGKGTKSGKGQEFVQTGIFDCDTLAICW